MIRATSVEPVNITPRTRGSATSCGTDAPSPGSSCSAPAARRPRAGCAPPGRRSAAFPRPAWPAPRLPAASAAATWPVKIASGKFHGLMQATGPSGRCVSALSVSRDLRRIVAQKVRRLAHFAERVWQRLAGFAHDQRRSVAARSSSSRSAARSRQAARSAGGVALPDRGVADRRRQRGIDGRGVGLHHLADHVASVGRIAHLARRCLRPTPEGAACHGASMPPPAGTRRARPAAARC